MANENMKKVLEFLNQDEELAKELLAMQPADAAKALCEKGIACTEDDLLQLADGIKQAYKEAGELNIEQLDDVAGGGKVSFYLGVACGAAVVTVALCAPW